MKKILLGLTSLLTLIGAVCFGICSSFVSSTRPVMAEVETATITIAEMDHGKISVHSPKESYEVGESVLLDVKADTFYLLDFVTLNGEELANNEQGELRVAVRSGENHIDAKFVIDQKILGEFAGMYESAQAHDWNSLFSIQNLFILIGFFFNSGIAIALVRVLISYKGAKTVDREEIVKTLKDAVPEQAKDIISTLTKEQLMPIIAQLSTQLSDVTQMCQKFIQAFLYSLEDTMESKEKIISLLSGLNLSDQNTIDELKKWFVEKMGDIELQQAEYKKLIDEMKESTEKALSKAKQSLPDEESAEQPEKEETEEVTYDGTSI